MNIQLRYRGPLAVLTGVTKETIEGQDFQDVRGLLKFLGEKYGADAEKTARVMLIALNGESIHLLRQFNTAIKDGDTVGFFPLCAGG